MKNIFVSTKNQNKQKSNGNFFPSKNIMLIHKWGKVRVVGHLAKFLPSI